MDRKTSSLSRLNIILIIVILLLAAIVGTLLLLRSPATNQTTTPPITTPNTSESTSRQPAIRGYDVQVAYISIGDEGKSGALVGCGDSIRYINKTVQATSAVEGALQALLSDKTERTQSDLYNALWQSNLTIDAVTVVDTTADVVLSGQMQLSGECDNPRVKAQLESTVKQVSGVETVHVMLNGKTIDEALSLK
jgi:osmotically-inducible protein OsmY